MPENHCQGLTPPSTLDRRNLLQVLGAAAACFGLQPLSAIAQTATGKEDSFPSMPLRIIVPLGPGSGADASTRFIAERLSKLLKQPVVVDNRPGGDLIIGTQAMLNAPPDGHTIALLSQSTMVVNAILNKDLPYQPQRDIRPLVASAGGTAVLVTGVGSKISSMEDVISLSRHTPKSLNLGNYGQSYRTAGLLMEDIGKLQFTHAPYKGVAPVINDLVGGTLHLAFMDPGAAIPLVKAGKLRALATTGRDRHPAMPEVRTLRESGLPGYEMIFWIGYGLNRKVPESRAQILQTALMKVIGDHEFSQFSQKNGQLQILNTPGPELEKRITSETERFRGLLEAAGRTS